MMIEQHTKGPWEFFCGNDQSDWANYFPVINSGGVSVIGTEGFYSGDRDVDIANAKLVAAAPELLAALEKAVSKYEKLPHSLGYEFTHIPEMRAAIAKAKGKV